MQRSTALPRWALGVIVVHVLLLAYLAWSQSPLGNEDEYLPSGICHWKTGRLEPSCRNPPLSRLVGALPVLLMPHKIRFELAVGDIYQHPGLAMMGEFLSENRESIRWLFFAGRLACISFSVLGAVVCYRWSRELFGPASAAVALLLWCFSPNILANNFAIMPDGVSASLGIWAAYRFRQWLREPYWPEALMAGVALGWTLLAKATWIGLLALWPVLWLLTRRYRGNGSGVRQFLSEATQLVALYVVALFLINAAYGFEGSFKLLGSYEFRSHALGAMPLDDETQTREVPLESGNRFRQYHLGWIPVPLPALYVYGIDIQRCAVERLRENYLFGAWSRKGWWYYYLAAALVKVPLGTWLLVVCAFGCALAVRAYRRAWREELWLLAPFLLMFLFLASQSGISRHFRYAVPLAPFLFVMVSRVAYLPPTHSFLAWVLACATCVGLANTLVSSLAVYPHSIAYFHEAVGGPRNGHKYLLGSNIDRNQDHYYLKQWQKAHPEAVNMAEHMRAVVATGYRAESGRINAGWYAISIDSLYHPKSLYRVLAHRPPIAQIGYTTYVFYVPEDIEVPEEESSNPESPSASDGQTETRSSTP